MNPSNTTNNPGEEKWLSMSEASLETPYSAEYLSLLARKKKLTAKKIGNTWYTTKSVLADYMKKQMIRAQVQDGNFNAVLSLVQDQTPNQINTIGPTEPIKQINLLDDSLQAKSEPVSTLNPVRSYPDDVRHYQAQSNKGNQKTVEAVVPVVESVKEVKPQVVPPILPSIHTLPLAAKKTPEPISNVEKIIPKVVPAVIKPAEVSSELERTLERVLDKKLGKAPLVAPLIKSPKSWTRSILSNKTIIAAVILCVISFTLLPIPFVFSAVGKSLDFVKKHVQDSNTIMGFRPGTGPNEILLLDKDGNISIMGHIETEGQIRSFIKDGTAPIVVDSKTQVNNLNSEYLNNMHSTEFTLAYVTQNGAVTTETVKLGGSVEVGKTLLVTGATKLASSLEVDGKIKAFGPAEFKKTIDVVGPAYFQSIIAAAGNISTGGDLLVSRSADIKGDLNTDGNLSVGKNENIHGSLNVGGALNAGTASLKSLGVSKDITAGGKISAASFSGDTITTTNTITSILSAVSAKITTLVSKDISVGALTATSTVTDTLKVNALATLSDFTFINATGTSLTTSILNIIQGTNGLTMISGQRATDLAPSGDFLRYSNATGSTTLFRVDNSGNLMAGGIVTTGSQTITSTSQPQFRVQYDAVNENTLSVSSNGVATWGANGTTPRMVWAPASNRIDTFQFQNSTGVPILNIDTINKTVTAENLLVNASSSFQNFTALNSTTTNATTTNFFATTLSSANLNLTNLLFINSTGTNATTTSLFSTTASTTNLFFTTGTGNLIGNITGTAPAGSLTGTTLASNVVNSSLTSVGTLGSLTVSGPSTFTTALHTGSTTLQNFTFINATGTNATTTNFFATTASTTNLFSTNSNTGTLTAGPITSGLINGQTISSSANFTGTLSATSGLTTLSSLLVTGNVDLATLADSTVSITPLALGSVSGNGGAPVTTLSVTGQPGQPTSGSTGQAGGVGSPLIFTAGAGGTAPVGSTNGVGGSITLQSGAPGAGLGTASTYGNILLQTAGGNLGIGTTSPFTKFGVSGNSYFGGSITATGTLAIAGATSLTSTLNTTGLATFSSLITTSATTSALGINSQTFTNLLGSGLLNNAGVLTVDKTGDWTGTFDGQEGTYYLSLANQTGTLTQNKGGTGFSSFTSGDILYADNSGNLTKLPIGTGGQVLKVTAGLPAWGLDQTIGSSGQGDGIFATSTGIIYPLDTSNSLILGNNATSTLNSVLEVIGQTYISTKLGIATTSPATALSVGGSGYITGGLGVGLLNTAAGTLRTSGDATIGGNLSVTGLTTFSTALHTGSTTLQNFTFINATGSAATTTNFFATTASSTNLFSTNGNVGSLTVGPLTSGLINGQTISSAANLTGSLTVAGNITGSNLTASRLVATDGSKNLVSIISAANLLASVAGSTGTGNLVFDTSPTLTNLLLNGSTTLQNFTSLNSTSTNATTTNFFSTTASTTNLFFTTGTGNLTGNLTGNVTGNITGTAPAGSLTGTTLASNVVNSSLTSVGTLGSLSVNGLSTLTGGFLSLASSTLQNFTFINATGTSATTTNFFATNLTSTTASTTNLFSTNSNLGVVTSGLINGQTISSSANFTGSITVGSNIILRNAVSLAARNAANTTNLNLIYLNGSDQAEVQQPFSALSTSVFAGAATFSSTLGVSGLSTLQNFTALNSTSTSATTTNFFATNLTSTNLNFTNLLFTNSTGTSATTTNFFSTTASTTNLFFTTGTGNLIGNVSGNITGSAPAGTLTGTTLVSNVVNSSLTSLGTLTALTVSGLSTFTTALHTGSTTLQNFTFVNATGTSATTTNFFATTASSTNLFSTNSNLGVVTSGLINGQTISSSANFTGSITAASNILLPNAVSLAARNAANTTYLNLIYLNGSDKAEVQQPFSALSTSVFAGGATFSSTLGVTGLTTLTNASTTQIGSTGSAYFATAGGNVGVGTTSPFAKLSVKGAGTTTGLNFQTTNSSDASTFSIQDSGNIGLAGGTTISGWNTDRRAIEGPTSAISFTTSATPGYVNLWGNAYYSTSAGVSKYKTTAGASTVETGPGTFRVLVAPSGTVDTAITFNTALSIINTGAATFGNTLSSTGDFAVNTNKFTVAASTGNTLVGGDFSVGTSWTFTPSTKIIGIVAGTILRDPNATQNNITFGADTSMSIRGQAGLTLASFANGINISPDNTSDVNIGNLASESETYIKLGVTNGIRIREQNAALSTTFSHYSAAGVPLTVKAAASQSAVLTNWTDSNNVTIASVGPTGAVTGGTYNGQTISSAANFTGTLGVTGLTTLTGGFLSLASSTLQNFTAVNSTSTSATSTNFFATNLTSTTASSTNLFSTNSNIGTLTSGPITSGLINGQTISSAANFTGSLTVAGTINATGNLIIPSGTADFIIRQSTASGSDTFSTFLGGGGAASFTRGAYVQVFGVNNVSTPGELQLGATTNASLKFYTASTLRFSVSSTTGTFANALAVTGDFAVNTNKFNVTASNGNTAVAGTLGVAGKLTVSAGGEDLLLNGATSNRVNFSNIGFAAPTFTSYSAGVKLVLYDSVAASNAGYTMGIESNAIFSTVDTTGQSFKWYGGTTLAATLTGAGGLTLVGGLSATTGAFSSTVTGTTLNGTTGINTGAGAGTQRIDVSGNLTNIGTITSGLINGQTISSAANFTGTVAVATSLNVGGQTAVSSPVLTAVGSNINSIEFGHTNSAGYRGTLGGQSGSGANFLALHAEGVGTGLYTTRGVAGIVYRSNLSGGAEWLTLTSNAASQSGTSIMTLSSAGALVTSSTINGQTISSAANFTGTIAAASTITGTTLNGTTGLNTGAGAGTQRIDASGNLSNIGTISSGAITSGLINGQTISSAANFTGTLNVNGAATFQSTLAVAGQFSVNGGVAQISSTGNLSLSGTSNLTGYIGIGGGVVAPEDMIYMSGTHTGTATSIAGVQVAYTAPATATSNIRGFWSALTTVNSAFTVTSLANFYSGTPTKGAASTITNAYGFYSADISGGTNNYAIYTNAGLVRFGDNVSTTGTLGVTGDFAINTNKFNVTASNGNTTVAGTLGVTGASTFTGLLTANNNITVRGTTQTKINFVDEDVGATRAVISLGTGGDDSLYADITGGNNFYVKTSAGNTLAITAGGASSFGGTLGVTGATTLSSTVGVSGKLTVSAGGEDILFNGGTSNYINFSTTGVAAPTFTTRSVGTKLVLYNSLGSSNVDYAIGIDNSTLWNSVQTTSQAFKWYGGTTLAATLSGAGDLTLVGGLSGTTGTFSSTVTGTTLNGTTGINTGAGAGTQRIDASGNLSNIGTISSGAITSGLINGQTISSAANFTGTVAAAGFINANGGIAVSGGGFAAGTITTTALSGLRIGAVTGSSSDFNLYTPGGSTIMSVPTGTQKVSFSPSATGYASINLGTGVAPTSPVNGDIWSTGSALFTRVSSQTAQLADSINAFTFGSTLGVTGDFAVNTNKFNVTASNGNTTIAGTLGVTGLTTLTNASTTQIGSTGSAYFATAGGNVGISSSTPYAKLSVRGAGASTGVNFQTTNSSDSPLFTILDSGNVGIGTSSPTDKLEVASGTNQKGIIITNTSQSPTLRFNSAHANANSRNWGMVTNISAFGDFALQQSSTIYGDAIGGTNRMYLDGTGGVGFNTTSTSRGFHYSGGLSFTGLQITNTAASKSYSNFISSAGDYSLYDETAGAYRITVTSGGKITLGSGTTYGAGTSIATTPDATYGMLHLVSNAAANYLTFTQAGYAHEGAIGFDASSDTMKFRVAGVVNGTTAMSITSGANVGIGSTSPYAKLSVKGAGTGTGVDFQTTNSNDTPLFTVLDNGNATLTGTLTSGLINGQTISSSANFTGTVAAASTITGTTLNGTTGINTGSGSGTQRIDASGNLSNIGTISSGAITSGLINGQTISSAANFTGTLTIGGSLMSGTVMSVNGNGGALGVKGISAGNSSYMDFRNSDESTRGLFGVDGSGFTGVSSNRFVIATWTNSPMVFYTNQAFRMALTETGNLGIGTTTPNNMLDIYSTSKAAIGFSGASGTTNKWTIGMDVSNGGRFSIASSTALGTTDRFVIDGNGNVGIGTTSPAATLAVAGDVLTNNIRPNGTYTNNLSAYDLGSTGARWNALWAGTLNVGTSTMSLKADNSSGLGFYTAASGGGTEAMTITSAGNIGIGTSTPAGVLDVVATSGGFGSSETYCKSICSFSGFNISDVNAGYKFTVNANGQITALSARVGDTSSHVIRLFNASGTEIASTTITGVVDTWVTSSITPVNVIDGEVYIVAVRTANYQTAALTTPFLTRSITINNGMSVSGVNTVPTTNNGNTIYPADITFQPATGGSLFTVTTSGVGIGTTTPVNKLSVSGNANVSHSFGVGTTTNNFRVLLSIGTNTTNVSGGAMFGSDTSLYRSGISALKTDGDFSASGDICTSTQCLNVLSDSRLKKDIQTLNATSTLDKLLQLNAISYKWNDDYFKLRPFMASTSADTQLGFIAQDAGALFPELLEYSSTTGYFGLDYAKFAPILVSAIQELSIKFNDAVATIASLGSRVDALSNTASTTAATLDSVTSAIGLNLADVSSGLDMPNGATIRGALKVDHIGSVGSLLTLDSDVLFIGTPFFNSDMGGIAVVEQGSRKVDVVFDKVYIDAPVINASVTLDASTTDAQVENIFGANVQYVVTNRSGSGFSILLSKAAPEKVSFSWTALSIKNMKITNSSTTIQPGISSTVIDLTSSTTPSTTTTSSTSTSTSTSTSSSTPTTTDTASSTPTIIPTDTSTSTPIVEPTSTTTSTSTSTSTDPVTP